MTIHFRPAITSEAKPLIGIYAESGRGKTKSALLLAKGFAGDMSRVGMVETESGRGEVYADDAVVGGYQVCPIREDFGPRVYGQAITVAESANLSVLIIDSASHEWEGAGGVLDLAAQNQAAGKKGPIVWQVPKIDHQRQFVLRLLQTPIPLVLVNMRAKYPMIENPPKSGKWERSKSLEPKQSEDILFEMMLHGWIDEQHAFHVTKWTKDEFRSIFEDGKPITVGTGERLRAWAAGKGATTKAPLDLAGQAIDFRRLMDLYSASAPSDFETLELYRQQLWPMLDKKQRATMKVASDEARVRWRDDEARGEPLGDCTGCPDEPADVHEPGCPRATR